MATSVPPWWAVAMQFGYFVGLALVLGGSLAWLVAIRPGLRPGTSVLTTEQCATLHRRGARTLRNTGWLFLPAAYCLFATRLTPAGDGVTLGATLGATFSPTAIGDFLTTDPAAGWATYPDLVLTQNVLYGLAILALVSLTSRRMHPHLTTVAGGAVALTAAGSATPSLPTSLSGLRLDDLGTQAFDQLHILSGATWVGGLLCLVLMTRRHVLGGAAGTFWAGVWQRFSLLALTAVGIVLTSGVWLAWKNVGSISELWTTTFGRFLVAKLLLVTMLVSAGAYNQLVLTPRIVRDARISGGDPSEQRKGRVPGFPRVVIVEAALGCCVLVIVPFLNSGSARAQAGAPPAATLDGGLLALSVCLVATLAGSLYATHRLSTHLVRQARAAAA